MVDMVSRKLKRETLEYEKGEGGTSSSLSLCCYGEPKATVGKPKHWKREKPTPNPPK